jgi:hypothetical protein
MKSKDQQLLEEAYTKTQLPVNEQEGVHNGKVRVYIIVRPDKEGDIFKDAFFSEQMAHAWLKGMAYPEAFKIKIYEQGPGEGIEIK